MITELNTIERETAKLAEDWRLLEYEVRSLDATLERIKSEAAPRIKRVAAAVRSHRGTVAALVQANPQLFEKPRTLTMHGFKVGFRKGAGGIAWEDEDRVVDLIRKHLGDQFEVLVKTTHRPVRDALAALSVADLKRIGCSVRDAGDEVVVKLAEGDAEKLVAPYLNAAE